MQPSPFAPVPPSLSPPPRRPGHQVSTPTMVLGIGAAVVFVAAVVGASIVGTPDAPQLEVAQQDPAEDGPAGEGGPGGSGEYEPPADPPDEWDEQVADLVTFVEQERGLEFVHPVEVSFLTEEEFQDELDSTDEELSDDELAEQAEETQAELPVLRAFGLVAGDLDLAEAVEANADEQTLAFYDSDAKRIVVPTTEELGVYDEVTLVHELTHALQDQHFNLNDYLPEDEEETSDEEDARYYASLALIEGDATRIQTAYVSSLPETEANDYYDSYDSSYNEYAEATADLPSILEAYASVPYTLGENFAALVAGEGGNAAVDRAFDDPPTTARHLLDPRTYLDELEPTDLEAPELPDSVEETVSEGSFDAIDVYLMLAERLDMVDSLDAADEWGAGRYVAYEDGDTTCVRLSLVTGPDDSGDVLQAGLEDWAQAMPDSALASVLPNSDGEGWLVDSCDPGPEPELPNDRASDALAVPYMRGFLAADFMDYMGMDIDAAWAASDCTMRGLMEEGLDLYGDWSEEDFDTFWDIQAECGVP